MAILALLGIFLLVGGLLYLPFFLWFRHRRRQGKAVGKDHRLSGAGLVLLAVELAALLGGIAAGELAPESSIGSLVHAPGGRMKWVLCVMLAAGALHAALARTRFATRKPPPAFSHTRASDRQAPRADESRLRVKVATVRGVPVFVHASFPTGGLMLAMMARPGLPGALAYCLAFTALIAIHEFGHFAAARALGLRVFSIDIAGWGGLCSTQVARRAWQTMVVYSGGLAAQAALFASTLAAVALLGAPRSAVGAAVYVTFTFVNAIVFVLNLIPGKTHGGLSTDGQVLWELLLHAVAGRPHPHAKQHAASPVFPSDTRLLTIAGMAPEGFTTGIELLNDDATPMEFVLEMLQKHAKLSREAAIATMLAIHQRGGALLPFEGLEQARAVADGITRDARASGRSLTCRAVDARTA